MATRWPADIAVIVDARGLGWGPHVERQPRGDGWVRQEEIAPVTRRHRIVAIVDDAKWAAWEAWLVANRTAWWAWAHPITGAAITARFVGGLEGVSATARVVGGTRRSWDVAAEIEERP